MIKRDITVFAKLPDIINTQQAAIILGVDVQTVRKWARNGELPAIKLGKRLWRFYKKDLMEFNQNFEEAV